MTPPFLPAIDIARNTPRTQALTSETIGHIGSVFATIDSSRSEQAVQYLQETRGRHATYLDVSSLASTEDILSILDSGATAVVVTQSQLEELRDACKVELDRLILSKSGEDHEGSSSADADGQVSIFWHHVPNAEAVEALLKGNKLDGPPMYISLAEPKAEAIRKCLKLNAIVVVPDSLLTLDGAADAHLLVVSDALLAKAVTDRSDGLFTTLVTDVRGTALGLVYSSRESVAESLRTGRGVYQSRKRGLWYKGESSGDTQELVRVEIDCDYDCLRFIVRQKGRGFCHLGTATCFGPYSGLSRLHQTLQSRHESAPEGSYTARLFRDSELLNAKILEEANELCEATNKDNVAFEAADLLYFALTKCVAAGVTLEDIEQNLDMKSAKVKRRKGDAKPNRNQQTQATNGTEHNSKTPKPANGAKDEPATPESNDQGVHERIHMKRYATAEHSAKSVKDVLERPSQRTSEKIISIVQPIIEDVRTRGDAALLEYTHKFDKATALTETVLKAPFPSHLMQVSPAVAEAIDVSFENIRRFHAAQKEEKPLVVETMPGVVCSRFCRPIESVGLYIPGGTAVLPSTALMLGVPAMVAGCQKIVLASPPRADGSVTPEIVYVANKVGAESIVLAGGAQAVAALAYGTETVTKVDKILGPGNQFVTAAKMIVSNDTSAGVSIDMPAGPSEVLVVADHTASPAFVAADLLSQAEHGVDSQVVLIAVDLNGQQLAAIEEELHAQASTLPRVDIVKAAIEHSVTLVVKDIEEAMALSNFYAPEHLILQIKDVERRVDMVTNAGSVFIGPWTPESVGDYSAGVNHSLPTCGYARQYSGVNLGSYTKHITSSKLTKDGLRGIGKTVMELADVEQLEAHKRAVEIRLRQIDNDQVGSS